MSRQRLTGPRWRRTLVAAVLVVGFLGTSTGIALSREMESPATPTPVPTYTGGVPCRGDTFAHVHDPTRLRLVAPCATVTGTVKDVSWQPTDGDWRVALALDPAYANVVPDIGKPLDVKVIPSDMATVALPKQGDRVAASGAWVLNRNQAREPELHPTWNIQRQDQNGKAAPSSPPRPANPDPQVRVNVPARVAVGDAFTLTAQVIERGPVPVPLAHLWLEVVPEVGPALQWKVGASNSAGEARLGIIALYRPGQYDLHLYVERRGRVVTVIKHLEVI